MGQLQIMQARLFESNNRKDSQIVQTYMIRIKNFTYEELRAGYRFQSRSILLQFFFVSFGKFVNSMNFAQEIKILPLLLDFTD